MGLDPRMLKKNGAFPGQALALSPDGTIWQPTSGLLALGPEVTGVDAFSLAATPVFTVPGGRHCAFLGALVRVLTDSGVVTPATVSLGVTGPTYVDLFSATSLVGVLATLDYWMFLATGVKQTLVPAGTSINLNVSVAAVGTSQTLGVTPIGFLF